MQSTSTEPRAKGPRDKPRTQGHPNIRKSGARNKSRNHEEPNRLVPAGAGTALAHAQPTPATTGTEVEIVQLPANIEQNSQRMILLDIGVLKGKLQRGERVGEDVAVLEAAGDSALLQGFRQITVVHDLAEMDFADLFDRLILTVERNVSSVYVDVLVSELVGLDGCLNRVLRAVVDRNAVAAYAGLKPTFRQLDDCVADIRTHRFNEFFYLGCRNSGEYNGLQKPVLCHFNKFRSLAAGHTRSRF